MRWKAFKGEITKTQDKKFWLKKLLTIHQISKIKTFSVTQIEDHVRVEMIFDAEFECRSCNFKGTEEEFFMNLCTPLGDPIEEGICPKCETLEPFEACDA